MKTIKLVELIWTRSISEDLIKLSNSSHFTRGMINADSENQFNFIFVEKCMIFLCIRVASHIVVNLLQKCMNNKSIATCMLNPSILTLLKMNIYDHELYGWELVQRIINPCLKHIFCLISVPLIDILESYLCMLTFESMFN